MIVYGYNNFLIKSFSPEEIGIPQEEGATRVQLQIRQRYAHLFWIPFFPIGKMWVIKKEGDNKLYAMPENIKKIVKESIEPPKTPWYSYTLILIGMAIGLVFYMSELQKKQSWEDDFYNNIEESKMLIQYPTTGDCYVFERYGDPDKWENDRIILKVTEYDESKILFISLYEDLYKDAESSDSYDYHNSFDLAELNSYNPTYIQKETLKTALAKEYRETSKPVKIAPLEGYYKLTKIDRRELED